MPEKDNGKKKKKKRFDDALIRAYSSVKLHAGEVEPDIIQRLKKRYEDIKSGYKNLLFQKMEAIALKHKDAIREINEVLERSFESRFWCVTELRQRGVEIKDDAVPEIDPRELEEAEEEKAEAEI